MDDQPAAARAALQEAAKYWSSFVARCISQRLENDRFQEFVQLVHAKHPLPPVIVADFFLRPQPSNHVSLDPRIPPYIMILTQLGYVNAPSILRVLYKYSALHVHDKTAEQRAADAEQAGKKEGDEHEDGEKDRKTVHWQDSSWAEEVMFYHVIRTVVEGSAFSDDKTALELVGIICKWMELFIAANATVTADMLAEKDSRQGIADLETARAAFVPLLLRLVDNEILVRVISKPFARSIRKHLSESLGSFIQTLQPVPPFVERLEVFRTETLAQLDPVDKKKQATNAAMDDLLDSTVGLESFVIADIPISNARASLYVYLNAAVSLPWSGV